MHLNLMLDALKDTKATKKDKAFWITLSKMQNTKFAVDIAAKKVLAVVSHDKRVKEAVRNLRVAKALITRHGATESIMAIFNHNDSLADAIGIQIPAINSLNARSVGITCCEGIDEKVVEAYDIVKKFFDDMISTLAEFFENLEESAACQYETIGVICEELLEDVEFIDAEEFAKDEVFGYTQPVFMERVAALKYIATNLTSLDSSADSLKTLEPYLKTLGYNVVEKAAEELTEPVPEEGAAAVAEEPELEIVEETEKEAEEDAPAPSEVMNPDPVVDDEPDKGDDVGKEPEAGETQVSTEEEGSAEPDSTPPESDGPADAPQEQNMAVFRWTPETIKKAAESLRELLGDVKNLKGVATTIGEIKGKVEAAIDYLQNAENTEGRAEKEAEIECGRRYAAYVSEVLVLFKKALDELVDQIICISAKFKSSEVEKEDEDAVPVEDVTLDDPLGEKTEARRKSYKGYRRYRYRNEGTQETPVVEEPLTTTTPPVETTPTEAPLVTDPAPVVETPITEPPIDPNEYTQTVEEPAPVPAVTEPAPEPLPPEQTGTSDNPVAEPPINASHLWNESEIEEPEGIPDDVPVDEPDAPKGVDPDGDPDPAGVTEPHREVVSTPEEKQPDEHAEQFLEQEARRRKAQRKAFWG